MLAQVKKAGDSLTKELGEILGGIVNVSKARCAKIASEKSLNMVESSSFFPVSKPELTILNHPYVEYDSISSATDKRLGACVSVLAYVSAVDQYYSQKGDPWALVTISDVHGEETKLRCWGYEEAVPIFYFKVVC